MQNAIQKPKPNQKGRNLGYSKQEDRSRSGCEYFLSSRKIHPILFFHKNLSFPKVKLTAYTELGPCST